ncbi:histidine--tRNA ligase [Candidatus Zinderia endosymbiont of Aphrophora alni]|uniref:histidine--tRNA ligase n=1 Tax=Candidatus Zinderia endosymbiont of Aphrophora alni TaxID=3077951 RepID=UPI0030D12877
MYSKNKKILSVKGMHDILPIDIGIWEFVENTIYNILNSYGFKKIITPIVEYTNLFKKTLYGSNDIFLKEMYSFQDKLNGEKLTLRPENTSGVIRSIIEHNLIHYGIKKIYYSGAMFRHEKPQFGRYRQFHQIGAEAIDYIGPDIDAEIIIMCNRIWKKLNIKNIILEINSIGDIEDRRLYNNDLIIFFKKYEYMFNSNELKKFYSNPISIFDTKNLEIIKIINLAPKLYNYINNNSIYHFEEIKKILLNNKIYFKINNYLVRGINYYNKTVFEWKDKDKNYSQNTICAGGRYDYLIEKISGKNIPGCGFAIGMERLIEKLKFNNFKKKEYKYDIYIIYKGKQAKLKSFLLAEKLRDIGKKVILHCEHKEKNSNIKSQIKLANKNKVKYSIIIGEKEIKNNTVIIKNMKYFFKKKQIEIPLLKIIDFFKNKKYNL